MRDIVVRLRRSSNIMEGFELPAPVVFCSQEIESSQYVVGERLPVEALRKRLLLQASCSKPLIQLLYTRYKLTLLSLQHLGIA
jgi:hypothetical protein